MVGATPEVAFEACAERDGVRLRHRVRAAGDASGRHCLERHGASHYDGRVPFFAQKLAQWLAPVVCLLSLACSRAESSPTPPTTSSAKAAPGAPTSATDEGPLVLAPGVRFTKAGPDSDVAKLVRTEREKAGGRDFVVYVGAKWCEPCQRFHEAAQRGELDGEFPSLTILEFDLDEDRARLTAAGYQSKLIPLFVRPADDGRASERRIEGGVVGKGAVGNITPRLRQLLAN